MTLPTPLLRAALGVVLALAAFAVPSAARAELIVFEDGRVVKAAGYRMLSDEIEVDLPGGGSYRVALERIERIVDDEVTVDTVAVEGDAGLASRVYDLSYQSGRKPLFGSAYDDLIVAAAKRSNIDASFVSALIRAESNYEPRALSRKGARGLMQLMPATARRLSVRRPYDPASNLDGGVRYLRELVNRFGNQPELVLAAYNAGEQAVETYGGVPPYRETVAYVNRILGWWQPASPEAAASPAAAAATKPAGRN